MERLTGLYTSDVLETSRERVASLARLISFEITPKDVEKAVAMALRLRRGNPVYITAIPGTPQSRLTPACRAIAEVGLQPVPHVTVRDTVRPGDLDAHLSELEGVGVERILLLGGSARTPAGPFESVIDALRSGVFDSRRITRIDIAGHPEGNPGVAPAAVWGALLDKQGWAQAAGVEMTVITQFAFEASAYLSWLADARASGMTLPVRFGLPGLVKTTTLIKYGMSCGIGPSFRVLRKQSGGVVRLATRSYSPDEMVLELSLGLPESERAQGAAGLHIFPFGAVESSLGYLVALQQGPDSQLGTPGSA